MRLHTHMDWESFGSQCLKNRSAGRRELQALPDLQQKLYSFILLCNCPFRVETFVEMKLRRWFVAQRVAALSCKFARSLKLLHNSFVLL